MDFRCSIDDFEGLCSMAPLITPLMPAVNGSINTPSMVIPSDAPSLSRHNLNLTRTRIAGAAIQVEPANSGLKHCQPEWPA